MAFSCYLGIIVRFFLDEFKLVIHQVFDAWHDRLFKAVGNLFLVQVDLSVHYGINDPFPVSIVEAWFDRVLPALVEDSALELGEALPFLETKVNLDVVLELSV